MVHSILIRFLTAYIGITGDYISALVQVYSQIVCKVCPQIFSETTQDAEFNFSTYLQFGLYLVPIKFAVNW